MSNCDLLNFKCGKPFLLTMPVNGLCRGLIDRIKEQTDALRGKRYQHNQVEAELQSVTLELRNFENFEILKFENLNSELKLY